MAKKQNNCPVPAGTLVIVGGAENKGEQQPEEKKPQNGFVRLEVLKTFTDLIKKEDPVLEVITTASAEGDEMIKDYTKAFKELGIKKIGHIHHKSRKEILDDPLEERVNKADAFYFSGGDQLLLSSIYGGTRFLQNLKERYIHDRIVVGGTSAGAMALSTPMIFAGSKEVEELAGEIKVTTGLEFLKDVCIDTHFVHRGRFVRMAQVIVTNPSCIGLGIEEDTAVIVRNGVEAEIVGSGTVIVIEGFHIDDANIDEFANKKLITIRNLKVHVLSGPDKYIIPQMNPPHK